MATYNNVTKLMFANSKTFITTYSNIFLRTVTKKNRFEISTVSHMVPLIFVVYVRRLRPKEVLFGYR